MPYKDKKKQLSVQQQHYQNNKDKYKDRLNARRLECRKYVAKLREESKCKNCGEDHPATLHFHHRDPSEKDVSISKAISNYSLTRLKKEIDKCDILCANCHAIHHYEHDDNLWTQNTNGRAV